MRSRTLANVLLLAIAVLACLWLAVRPQPAGPRREPLTNISGDDIKRIVIRPAGAPPVIFQRARQDAVHNSSQGQTRWRLIEPLPGQTKQATAYANEMRIGAMLALLHSHSRARFDYHAVTNSNLGHPQINLDQLDLANPKLILELDDQVFHFGGIDPLNQHRYVRLNDAIHLIQDSLYPQLLQPPAFFISKHLLPPDFIIDRISLPDFTLRRQADGWAAEPEDALAQHQLRTLIKNWQTATAQAVTPISLPRAGRKVIVATEEGGEVAFQYVVQNNGVFLIRKTLGVQYEISRDAAAALGLKANKTGA